MKENNKNKYLKNLNNEQLEAVYSTEGPVLILAGAGTGKTHTMVSRVANLLDNGISGNEILLITFTNKAAGEIKSRVEKYIRSSEAKKVTACTFHSFFLAMLHNHAKLIGFESNFSIISPSDSLQVVDMYINVLLKDLKDRGKEILNFPTAADILKANSYSINNMISIDSAISLSDKCCFYPLEVKQVINQFMEYKKTRSKMDYDDILLYAYELLHNNENIRKKYDAFYKYIMVDEYQDTNIIQNELVMMLSKDINNIAVVGDDNQSIYKFRGANVENILNFEKNFPSCKTIKLVKNYRSTQEILDLSNEVMSHATEGIRKDLISDRNGELPSIYIPWDDKVAASLIIGDVRNKHQRGLNYSEMAVIVRNSFQYIVLESELIKRNIPYKIYGGKNLLDRVIVKDILSFLRCSISHKEDISWYQILLLYPHIGSKRAMSIMNDVFKNGEDIIIGPKYNSTKYCEGLKELHHTVAVLKSMSPYEQMSFLIKDYYPRLMKSVIEGSKSAEYNKQEKLSKLKRDLLDMEPLIDISKDYVCTEDFLESLIMDSNREKEDKDCLIITTIHSAKGLEFDSVYLLNPVDGVFPSCKEDVDDAEELRCLYVALTRAKNDLKIIVSREGIKNGHPVDNKLSRHLAYDDVIEKTKHPAEIYWMFPESDNVFHQKGYHSFR